MFVSSLAGGRPADAGKTQDAIALSFAYALEDIPTSQLDECFKRAIREKTDDFPLTAAAVRRQLDAVVTDLQEQQRRHDAEQEELLKLNGPRAGEMRYDEWKARHNLPEHWRATMHPNGVGAQGYPIESDLYSGPFPDTRKERQLYFERRIEQRKRDRFYRCFKCKDSGWTRIPFDARTGYGPTLVRCDCMQDGNG